MLHDRSPRAGKRAKGERSVIRYSLFILCLGLTACGGAAIDDFSADELSMYSRSFVSLRRDERRCPSPACGGYWAKDLNRTAAERYVSGLDFGPSGLDAASISEVTSAPAEEVALRARLGPADGRGYRKLLVYEAYRGMPGVRAAAGDSFFKAADRNPRITCFAAPCPNLTATSVNIGGSRYFSNFDAGAAAKAHVDQEWLVSRAQIRGAVVAGKMVDGVKYPGGFEKVLSMSQVFVRLPEAMGPCPKSLVRKCEDGAVETYDRTADRCLVQTGCAKTTAACQARPACEAGYRLETWNALPNGCEAFACDPAFVR